MTSVTPTRPAGRRERKKAETAQKIVEAAVRVFTRKGFAQATVEEITEASDVGKGTFFNYFRSKEHILLGIMEAAGRQFDAMGEAAAAAPSARHHVTSFAHNFLSHPSRTPMLLRNIFGIALAHASLRRPLLMLILRIRRALLVVMERGQQSGEIRADIPAADLARSFQQFMLGTQIMWSLDEDGDLLERVDQMIEIFWRGAAPSAESRPARRVAKEKK